MIFDEKDGCDFNDVKRRISNLIRLGTIKEIDYAKAKARVQIGNLLTDWLPWVTQCAGQTVNWCPLEKAEQVIVLATTGDLCQGVILGSLYRCNAPSQSPTLHTICYSDGSTISFDIATSTLTADIKGDVNITANGNAAINVSGNVTINASGNVSVHAGGNASVESNQASVKASTITLDGNTTITGDLNGVGEMSLAGGGQGVARAGDPVQVDPTTHIGTIIGASSKVTAG